MKKLTTLLMTLMLASTALWAEETITVSANSSDISEGLDLKVVAKLFAEAKNLEEFETMLNNPDSAFCNLDLNGDGQVDYLRVVEIGEGNKRLIVLQAILAKDIFQDVASIYVEKNEKNEVSVQIIGDEYVYGTNYIIEPVYVYRPVIYDWFWSPAWYAWTSPWYWGYWPGWWYVHNCWAHDWYWHHCYAFHHHHHYCSFRPGRTVRHGYHELHSTVGRRDYAIVHPDNSFARRNSGMTNAREIRNTLSVRSSRTTGIERNAANGNVRSFGSERLANNRTFGSTNTAVSRSTSPNTATRGASNTNATTRTARVTTTRSASSTNRSTNVSKRSTSTVSRSTSATNRSSSTSSRTSNATSRSSITRSTSVNAPSRSSSGSSRSSGGTYSGSSRSGGGTYSGGSRSGGSTYSGGGYSGGSRGGSSSAGGGRSRR